MFKSAGCKGEKGEREWGSFTSLREKGNSNQTAIKKGGGRIEIAKSFEERRGEREGDGA